jgi:hypothetical protein
MTDRIKEIIEEHGFMPDNDLYELAEIIAKECASVCDADGDLCSMAEEVWRNHCRDAILKHFDLPTKGR